MSGDSRCDQVGLSTVSCTLTSDGSAVIQAVAPQGGTVTFSVSGTAPEADPSDNSTTVTLD